MTRSQMLFDVTRDLILTYRAHRIRLVRGSSDTGDGVTDGQSTHDPTGRFDGRTRLPEDKPAIRASRGTAGGLARAAKLTAEQRQDIARRAAEARWERFRNGVGTGPPDPRLGGAARARSLTPERRRDIARQASQVLWERVKPPEPDAAD